MIRIKLYVIGNGFDLAHKLPTQYWDFRTYLCNVYPDFLNEFEQHYYIYPNESDESKRDILWNCFETNLANINEDIIIEDATNMDLGLESGDYGIEETLRWYFREEYKYINSLEKYLKQWVRTVKIRDTKPHTSFVDKNENDFYITFNYTSVLENVYGIDPARIIHIHGSLHEYDDDPILGHGNLNRIQDIKAKRHQAETYYNEKEMSICKVVEEYYQTTFKNVQNYMYKLNRLSRYDVKEIVVVGHSVAGVDMPYFKRIHEIFYKKPQWTVYYFKDSEKESIAHALEEQGIYKNKYSLLHCNDFYNLL